ncbi:MAG: family 43 glycosylhydrolase [Epulopiscium sp.]|nr:family 43 glycosylhydrolase [Candidatus Epulonipiscium sp.]
MSIENKIEEYRKEGFPKVWVSDQGDGTFKNPVLHADYSDPDIIRVGDDFFMVASSFNCIPGLPVLHSKDLVNWQMVNYIVDEIPFPNYSKPQHGRAIWAPSIRYHDGYYWVYVGMPDEGIFMSKTQDPFGKWDPLVCVKKVRGWIDPCPFWDDDGNAYLVNAFARSRIGFKSVLAINKMDPDGTRLLDEFRIVIDGNMDQPTIEGPKMYKRNGYYYISAPAGGVATGWQVILRSKHVYGPYETKKVLHQGNTPINGPHQGGWVELESGETWFMHFQDKGAYGRIVHLQPVHWVEDWPLMGENSNEKGMGEPVLHYKKPEVGQIYPIQVPVTSDDFNEERLGLQWQWHANEGKKWYSLKEKKDHIRLYCVNALEDEGKTLWETPNLLMQKFPALQFEVTTKMEFHPTMLEDQAGLVVMGFEYASLTLQKAKKGMKLVLTKGNGPENIEKEETGVYIDQFEIYFRVTVTEGAECFFSYSLDGKEFVNIGEKLIAREGRWIGAKVGIFSTNLQEKNSKGYADFDWVLVEEI